MNSMKGKRAILYARVSKGGEQTNENQLPRLREASQFRGYQIVAEFTDERSGADPNRPGLDSAMQMLRKHQADLIFIVRIDRIMRSVLNLHRTTQEIESLGAHLVCLDQPIDTSTPMGRFVLTVLGGMAEFELELNRDRTLDGLARARAEGRVGGRPRRKLTEYQKEKARAILKENPDISQVQLAKHFKGISRTTLISLLKEEGIL